MKPTLRTLTALTLSMTVSANALAATSFTEQTLLKTATAPGQLEEARGNGVVTGNGGGDPTVAFSEEQIQKINENMNLDYLQLTPAQIAERDKKLKPIYDFYREATVTKVAKQIEVAFGSYVYHFQSTAEGLYTPSLTDKRSTMDSAIRFYSGYDLNGTPFANASSQALPGRASVSIKSGSVGVKLVSGDPKRWDSTYYSKSSDKPFLLQTYKSHRTYRDAMGLKDWDAYALFTSSQNPLFDAPVLDNFLTAIQETNIKGLDASLVFTSGSVQGSVTKTRRNWGWDSQGQYVMGEERYLEWSDVAYQVVYPTYSRTAPIPQPMVFISPQATTDDLVEMLNTHAPRIYAYNQLFNQKMLPQADEISRLLKKHPEFLEEVKKAAKNVKQENAEVAAYKAFLMVSFGMMAASVTPVVFAAMLASPILMPILVHQTVIILSNGG